MEDVDPHALGGPSNKAIVERLSWPVDLRGIDPSAARLQDVHNAADDTAVIDSRFAARASSRPNCSSVSQKQSRFIVGLPLETMNHKPAADGIPFMGPDPSTTLALSSQDLAAV
jgi:hypothetical protein